MKAVDFDEKEFKKLFPVTENSVLAKKYKVAESTIRLWGSRLKLNKKTWGWSANDERFILKHYGKKYTATQLAEKFGRKRWAIINKYRELRGLRKPEVIEANRKKKINQLLELKKRRNE